MPLVLRGLLYLKVEVDMEESNKKDFRVIIDYKEDYEEDYEEMDRVLLDTGDEIIELPEELIPYLQEYEILGIA